MPVNNSTTPYRTILPNDYSAYAETSTKIPVGSTLSVAGALITIARDRFRGTPDESVPWVWVPYDNNPHQADPNKSTIRIEMDTEQDNAEKNVRPSILLGRGTMTEQAEVLDRSVAEARNTGKKIHYTTVYTPYSFTCRAHKKGTSEVIANIMFEWLLYNRNPVRATFQFREFGPFQMSRETPVPGQTDVWETTVEFRVAWEHRYSVRPKAMTLSSVVLSIYGTLEPHAPIDDSMKLELLERVVKTSLTHTPSSK